MNYNVTERNVKDVNVAADQFHFSHPAMGNGTPKVATIDLGSCYSTSYKRIELRHDRQELATKISHQNLQSCRRKLK